MRYPVEPCQSSRPRQAREGQGGSRRARNFKEIEKKRTRCSSKAIGNEPSVCCRSSRTVVSGQLLTFVGLAMPRQTSDEDRSRGNSGPAFALRAWAVVASFLPPTQVENGDSGGRPKMSEFLVPVSCNDSEGGQRQLFSRRGELSFN